MYMNIFRLIKDNISFTNVAHDYLPVMRNHSHYSVAHCPHHQNKYDSNSLYIVNEFFNCIPCQKGGDIISFIAHMHQCSMQDAIRILVEKYDVIVSQEVLELFLEQLTESKKT